MSVKYLDIIYFQHYPLFWAIGWTMWYLLQDYLTIDILTNCPCSIYDNRSNYNIQFVLFCISMFIHKWDYELIYLNCL